MKEGVVLYAIVKSIESPSAYVLSLLPKLYLKITFKSVAESEFMSSSGCVDRN